VIRTRVGYAGGEATGPTYTNLADHTEAIEIVYDPDLVTYEALLDLFWQQHSPTSAPFSRQYRSAIFPADDAQLAVAHVSMAHRAAQLGRPLHTAIEADATFWVAEGYHQKHRVRGERMLLDELSHLYANEEDFVASTAVARVNGMLAGYGLAEDIADLGLSAEAQALLRTRLEARRR
jgi:peptide-methionine (S)-S-oxide reductase